MEFYKNQNNLTTLACQRLQHSLWQEILKCSSMGKVSEQTCICADFRISHRSTSSFLKPSLAFLATVVSGKLLSISPAKAPSPSPPSPCFLQGLSISLLLCRLFINNCGVLSRVFFGLLSALQNRCILDSLPQFKILWSEKARRMKQYLVL